MFFVGILKVLEMWHFTQYSTLQEEEQEGSIGANSDSDAEFEQMLAAAEDPKPSTAAAASEDAAQKEDDPNAAVR